MAAIKRQLTEKEKAYILENYHDTSVMRMARKLHRANMTIYDFLDAEGLEAFRTMQGVERVKRRPKREYFDESLYLDWLTAGQ